MIKNGKLFGKINLFDFLVILLAIILVIACVGYFGLKASSGEKPHKMEAHFDFCVEDVRIETVSAFEAGQPIFSNTTKEQIGIISNIACEPATQVMETLDGKLVNAPVENRYNLTLTIRSAIKSYPGKELWINTSEKILDGQYLTFLTQKNKCYGMIKNIEVTNDFGELTSNFASFAAEYYLGE